MIADLKAPSGYTCIGQCGRAYGYKGWFHLQSFTSPPKNILNYESWTLYKPGQSAKPVILDKIKPHGNHFVAKLVGIDSKETLIGTTNQFIAVLLDALPTLTDEKEHYWVELLGLTALLPNGETLGKVVDLFETAANSVIVIKTKNDQEILIPYIDNVVQSVSIPEGSMTLDWDPKERYEKK